MVKTVMKIQQNKILVRDGCAVVILGYKRHELECLIDVEDIPLIKSTGTKWCAQRDRTTNTFYCICNTKLPAKPRRQISMHRLICNFPEGLGVDHKDHNGLNKRRENLRVANNSQNQRNKRVAAQYIVKRWRSWTASYSMNGKRVHLGRFDSEDAAREALNGSLGVLSAEDRSFFNIS